MIFSLFSVRTLYNSKICPEEFHQMLNAWPSSIKPLGGKKSIFFILVSSTQKVFFSPNMSDLDCNDLFSCKYVNKEVF